MKFKKKINVLGTDLDLDIFSFDYSIYDTLVDDC